MCPYMLSLLDDLRDAHGSHCRNGETEAQEHSLHVQSHHRSQGLHLLLSTLVVLLGISLPGFSLNQPSLCGKQDLNKDAALFSTSVGD